MELPVVTKLRALRQEIEKNRGGARPDVARELSIAVTHIEDAEMRLVRALVRISRHKADADSAVESSKIATNLIDDREHELSEDCWCEPTVETVPPAPDEAGEASDSDRKEVG